MFPGAKKDCCGAGHCEKSKSQKSAPAKECKRMPLEPAGSAQMAAELPSTDTTSIDRLTPVAPPSPAAHAILPVDHSPPDLQVINATFLI
jgi:hypothetical protein